MILDFTKHCFLTSFFCVRKEFVTTSMEVRYNQINGEGTGGCITTVVSSTYRTDMDAFVCRHITDKISTFIFLSSEKINIIVL